jgi:uncharacterized protein (DUF58 family)
LAPELIKQIRGIELKAGRLVTDALAGGYLSVFRGRGMEFDEVREYVPGDDVRTIDWNVTARTRTPHVKILREERELTVMLMVDVSASQRFGTSGRDKREIAAELAAVLAFLAIRNNDKVGLVVFSGKVETFLPPKKGRAHVWNLIRSVLTHKYDADVDTDIGGALDFVANMLPRRAMCFLISDFWTDGYETAMRLVARRHELICVRTEDPRERELPPVGLVAVADAETGDEVWVDAGSASVRSAFAAAAAARTTQLESIWRRAGADSFCVSTADDSVATPLVQYFRRRERRLKRS